MSANKTTATDLSVESYLAAKATASQHADALVADCRVIQAMMTEITGEPAVMWGPSIVGFGRYHYIYDSGRSGDACLTGFAIRGREIVLYLVAEMPEQQALLAQLGRCRTGKACVYIKALADVNIDLLRKLIADSVAELLRRYRQ